MTARYSRLRNARARLNRRSSRSPRRASILVVGVAERPAQERLLGPDRRRHRRDHIERRQHERPPRCARRSRCRAPCTDEPTYSGCARPAIRARRVTSRPFSRCPAAQMRIASPTSAIDQSNAPASSSVGRARTAARRAVTNPSGTRLRARKRMQRCRRPDQPRAATRSLHGGDRLRRRRCRRCTAATAGTCRS